MIWLLANWKMVVGGILAAAFIAMLAIIGIQSSRISYLKANYEFQAQKTQEAAEIADRNIKAYYDLKEQNARDMAAVKMEQEKSAQRLQNVSQKLKEIANAPASDNGPVAPVLSRTIDSLRAQPGNPDKD